MRRGEGRFLSRERSPLKTERRLVPRAGRHILLGAAGAKRETRRKLSTTGLGHFLTLMLPLLYTDREVHRASNAAGAGFVPAFGLPTKKAPGMPSGAEVE
jgi:hypothetical protein